jgi:ABC-type glycerol-3-phosphate transport system substrate-binding protein
MSKSLKLNSLLGALIAVAVSAGVLTAPAKAAEQVTLTIWTFGEVIQPGLQREYQKLHPEVKIIPIKNDVDPLHQKTILSCQTGGPADIIAFETPYSGYWRTGNRPNCFQDLRQLKTSDTNAAAGVAAG